MTHYRRQANAWSGSRHRRTHPNWTNRTSSDACSSPLEIRRTVLDLYPRSDFMLRHVKDLLPIGDFAQRSGLSPKRLRSYAAVGLLIPESVDASSGYRYYAPDQLRTARLIDALREAGMPLADIGTLLRDPSGERLDAWATRVQVDAAQRQ